VSDGFLESERPTRRTIDMCCLEDTPVNIKPTMRTTANAIIHSEELAPVSAVVATGAATGGTSTGDVAFGFDDSTGALLGSRARH
jgi:hypothetical protein